MISIVSVHIDTKWKKLQAEQFEKFTRDCHVIATGAPVPCNGSVVKNHCDNINELILSQHDGIDMVVVCDSDAFPVVEWDVEIRSLCQRFDFVAVQRLEHHREYKRQPPHPSFVAWNPHKTNIFFYVDEEYRGPTVAGWQEMNWMGLHRQPDATNIRCGVYGGLIYHHGFGSRPDDGFNGEKEYKRIEKSFWGDPVKFVEACK